MFLARVSSLVEVGEEEEEHDSVQADPDHEALGVVALSEEQLELVGEDQHKLDHLKRGEIFLPPDVLLVLGSHGSHHVVEVHDDVDEGVQQSKECAMTAWSKFHSHPNAHGHAAMVNHMQCRHMLILLAQHEEQCVKKLRKL